MFNIVFVNQEHEGIKSPPIIEMSPEIIRFAKLIGVKSPTTPILTDLMDALIGLNKIDKDFELALDLIKIYRGVAHTNNYVVYLTALADVEIKLKRAQIRHGQRCKASISSYVFCLWSRLI